MRRFLSVDSDTSREDSGSEDGRERMVGRTSARRRGVQRNLSRLLSSQVSLDADVDEETLGRSSERRYRRSLQSRRRIRIGLSRFIASSSDESEQSEGLEDSYESRHSEDNVTK